MTRLLAFGNDDTLALPPAQAMGDTHQRQLQYASILDAYHYVTLAPPGQTAVPLRPAPNFTVYPCAPNMRRYLPAAIRTGRAIVQQHGVDVISAQDPFLTGLAAYRVARAAGLPLNLQFAADMVDNPHWLALRPLNRLLNWLAHWLIRRADSFRVVSQMEQQKLARLGVPPSRIWNLGWITDFSRFLQADGTAVRAGLQTRPDERLLLFVGRLAPQKELGTLLRAFARVRDRCAPVRLVLVGDGPLAAQVRQQIDALRLSDAVTLTGMVSYGDIPAVFAAADAFVLTSIYEGNARVLAEAAAAALPAVSTDVSGTRDTILDGETGFVVPVGDETAVVDRVTHLLKNPAAAEAMGRRGRAHILQLYDRERLLAGFHDLWQATATHRFE